MSKISNYILLEYEKNPDLILEMIDNFEITDEELMEIIHIDFRFRKFIFKNYSFEDEFFIKLFNSYPELISKLQNLFYFEYFFPILERNFDLFILFLKNDSEYLEGKDLSELIKKHQKNINSLEYLDMVEEIGGKDIFTYLDIFQKDKEKIIDLIYDNEIDDDEIMKIINIKPYYFTFLAENVIFNNNFYLNLFDQNPKLIYDLSYASNSRILIKVLEDNLSLFILFYLNDPNFSFINSKDKIKLFKIHKDMVNYPEIIDKIREVGTTDINIYIDLYKANLLVTDDMIPFIIEIDDKQFYYLIKMVENWIKDNINMKLISKVLKGNINRLITFKNTFNFEIPDEVNAEDFDFTDINKFRDLISLNPQLEKRFILEAIKQNPDNLINVIENNFDLNVMEIYVNSILPESKGVPLDLYISNLIRNDKIKKYPLLILILDEYDYEITYDMFMSLYIHNKDKFDKILLKLKNNFPPLEFILEIIEDEKSIKIIKQFYKKITYDSLSDKGISIFLLMEEYEDIYYKLLDMVENGIKMNDNIILYFIVNIQNDKFSSTRIENSMMYFIEGLNEINYDLSYELILKIISNKKFKKSFGKLSRNPGFKKYSNEFYKYLLDNYSIYYLKHEFDIRIPYEMIANKSKSDPEIFEYFSLRELDKNEILNILETNIDFIPYIFSYMTKNIYYDKLLKTIKDRDIISYVISRKPEYIIYFLDDEYKDFLTSDMFENILKEPENRIELDKVIYEISKNNIKITNKMVQYIANFKLEKNVLKRFIIKSRKYNVRKFNYEEIREIIQKNPENFKIFIEDEDYRENLNVYEIGLNLDISNLKFLTLKRQNKNNILVYYKYKDFYIEIPSEIIGNIQINEDSVKNINLLSLDKFTKFLYIYFKFNYSKEILLNFIENETYVNKIKKIFNKIYKN